MTQICDLSWSFFFSFFWAVKRRHVSEWAHLLMILLCFKSSSKQADEFSTFENHKSWILRSRFSFQVFTFFTNTPTIDPLELLSAFHPFSTFLASFPISSSSFFQNHLQFSCKSAIFLFFSPLLHSDLVQFLLSIEKKNWKYPTWLRVKPVTD